MIMVPKDLLVKAQMLPQRQGTVLKAGISNKFIKCL